MSRVTIQDRRLLRDTQRKIDELTDRVNGTSIHADRFIQEAAARDRETDQRFRDTDARIQLARQPTAHLTRNQSAALTLRW